MIDAKFVLIGALFNLYGSVTYVLNTLKGKTQPNRVTWFLWALAPLIAFGAQIHEGVGLQSLMTFMVGFGPLLIFISSFVNRKAYWKITRLDIFCGLISVLALILFLMTGTGLIAIMMSILADLIAGVPTIIKSYYDPDSESSGVFRNGAISAIITLLALDRWNFASYGFPLYILMICLVLYFLIRFRIGKRFVNRPSMSAK